MIDKPDWEKALPSLPCSKCHETRPVSEFHPRASKPRGYESRCKECVRIAWRERHAQGSAMATRRRERQRELRANRKAGLPPLPSRFGTHHGSTSREYKSWLSMKDRCSSEKADSYPQYGGRGIGVCERWVNSFANFLADMGPRPTPAHSLDRIDNDAGYTPENCRWASPKEQSNNRRTTVRVTIGDATKTLPEWAEFRGVNLITVQLRYRNGITGGALFAGLKPYKHKPRVRAAALSEPTAVAATEKEA